MHSHPEDTCDDVASPSEPPTNGTPVAIVGRRRAVTTVFGGLLALGGAASACTRGGAAPADQAAAADTPPAHRPGPSAPDLGERDPDVHRLRRLTFGPTSEELTGLRSEGFEAWFDQQLAPGSLDTTEVDRVLGDAFPELGHPAPDLVAAYRVDDNGQRLAAVLPGAALVRHTQSPAQVVERVVEFWGDHFNVPQVNPPSIITRIVMDREVLRRHALGRFDDLLVATVQSPAMLMYLDNFQSRAGAINENHARELLELHTLGVNGGYDEADIVKVARLLTGWTITRDLEFRFDPRRHDHAPLEILGWRRPETDAPLDHGVDFLRHLARRPETARHVSRKLAVRFIADDPGEEVVEAMAAAWVDNDTAVVPVLRTMVAHHAFIEAPPKFNRPWDHLTQTLRAVGATVDPSFAPDLREAIGAIRNLGQLPFRWPSPDGYPDVESAWLHAGGLLARWSLAVQLTGPTHQTFPNRLRERIDELRGATAIEIFESLTRDLRQQPLTDDRRSLLSELTGWQHDHVPTDDELTDLGPHLAFALLTGPDVHHR